MAKALKRSERSKTAPKQKKSKTRKSKSQCEQLKVEQLVVDNREYGMRLAWSLLKRWRVTLDSEDVKSSVGLALVEAAVRYDETKGAEFRTFFFYHLRGILLKEISTLIQEQKLLKKIPTEAVEQDYIAEKLPYQLIESVTPEVILSKRQFNQKLWQICELLDDLEKEVVTRHFVYDEPLKYIAEDLNYCRCHISRVKSKALKKIAKSIPTFFEEFKSNKSAKPGITGLASQIERKKYKGGRGRRKIEETSPLNKKDLKVSKAA